MFEKLFRNHVLANLAFVLVLVVGFIDYGRLPREQDPEINFNWIVINTVLPGASATDVEKRITDPLEDAIRKVHDIKFVSSNSREGVSSILVRFEDISARVFDKRVTDLRREVQNKQDELPEAAEDPLIQEITSANAFPTATVAISGQADDEVLRYQAYGVKRDLERLAGVDRIDSMGLNDPELQVLFYPERLATLGVSPNELADTVAAFFRDMAAGTVKVRDQNWLVRMVGTDSQPGYLARLPILGAKGEVPLGSIARVVRGREKAATVVDLDGHPAVALSVMKEGRANILDLMDRIKAYIADRNSRTPQTGVKLTLVDDQTVPTRRAIDMMETNAVLGLLFVLAVTWVFLGTRISLLVTIGIPFILAGTFWALSATGQTLNVTVLLGVVISLGMLVDDAVVVVEAIYYRLQRGQQVLSATLDALREVTAPVISAVLTTMAAFLPLMLLPGILGDFMRLIPMVVTLALAISLLEAFWMLPAHVTALRISYQRPSRIQRLRHRFTHSVQIAYTRGLLKVLRYPKTTLISLLVLFVLAIGAVGAGFIKMDFFASDPKRVFYVSVEMPSATSLNQTLAKVREIEAKVRKDLRPGEARAVVSYAGQMFTETAPMQGDHYGQVLVGLNPPRPGMRSVDEIMDAVRADARATPGPVNVSLVRITGGPPTSRPINVKVRGDDYGEVRRAADAIEAILGRTAGVTDVSDDASRGRMELVLAMDQDAVRRAGLSPAAATRALRLLVDGDVVATMQHQGQELDVRVRAAPKNYQSIDAVLDRTLPLPGGGEIALRQLFHHKTEEGLGNIRHYNFRRAITVEADIKPGEIDTVTANRIVREQWRQIAARFPNIALDFSGQLEDVQESIDAIAVLFVFGVGLMYLILGTQFRSYFQPMMILATVPMAFTGVVLGLLISRNPLSLYTLYGVVALAGIAVNSAIVLISAANDRLARGMSLLHATVYAARRRVIPILITSLTTIAGLMSLALGLGGKSLIWGPVATAIVWGLAFSTVLTLLVIPLLYRLSMGRAARRMAPERQ
jgi:multidrug efflux pump subunit AcrB